MPITLAQAKSRTQNKVYQHVIDEYRKSSFLLDNLIFDNTVVAQGSGSGITLDYTYHRVVTPGTAAFRAINTEYTPQEAETEKHTASLAIFGGSFEIDRVVARMDGVADNVTFQVEQKVKAARNLFHHKSINGDTALNGNEFDGLNKMLAGSSTEFYKDAFIDLSDSEKIKQNYSDFLLLFDKFLNRLDGKGTAIMVNGDMKSTLTAVARIANALGKTKDAFGEEVETYKGIPIIDLAERPGEFKSVIDIYDTRKPDGTNLVTGLSDIYVGRFGLDGLHGISEKGDKIVNVYLPDFKTPGAVKTGEVEMLAGLVLKATKSAGVFRNIKIR